MEDLKSDAQRDDVDDQEELHDALDDQEELHDALDDFTFYDCVEAFFESDDELAILSENPSPYPMDENLTCSGIRRRRSHSLQDSYATDSTDLSNNSSPVKNIWIYQRERKSRGTREHKECVNELGNSAPLAVKCRSNPPEVSLIGEKEEKTEQPSTVTNTNVHDNIDSNSIECTGESVAKDDSSMRGSQDTSSCLLLALAGIAIKLICFQILVLGKVFMFPIRSLYFLHMLVYDPFRLTESCRQYLFEKIKFFWSFRYQLVSKFMFQWFKEHQSIWKLGLKCGWGLLWSFYVCMLLVGFLLSAFVMSGILMKVMVEEPTRIQKSLNFDYKEKSPVAYVPIVTGPEFIHDVYLGASPNIGKASGLRTMQPNHKLKVTVSLTLPESEYNQHLGNFQIRVDFLDADSKVLAMSRRPCMLQFRSPPIQLLLTLLKVAPILTGYTSETQKININFKGFTRGEKPIESLRVVIEQRAEFSPGGGVPEIYSSYLTLESELPLVKRLLWFWKKTLFVWISMVFFSMELFFALVCCRPVVFPRVRLRGAAERERSREGGSS